MNAKQARSYLRMAEKLANLRTEEHKEVFREGLTYINRKKDLRLYMEAYILDSIIRRRRTMPFYTTVESDVPVITKYFKSRGFNVDVKIEYMPPHPRRRKPVFYEAKFNITF